MNKILLALLCVNASLLIAEKAKVQKAKVEEIGKSPTEVVFAAGGQLHLDLCSSAAEIQGIDEDKVRVSYSSEHDSTGHVRVKVLATQKRADVSVEDCPHNNFQLKVEVPKSAHLYVRMFAGELQMRDVVGDKDVQVHTGQVTMHIGQASDYAHVDGSVTTGELDAPAFAVSKGGLFRSFQKTGPGKYRLHAHVGAGELDIL